MTATSEYRLRPPIDDVEWVARWVWYEQERIKGFDHAHFRQQFELDSAPTRLRVLVSAETAYELWCNGTRVGRGSLPSDPRWKTYDEHDVTGLVNEGVNVLALVVEYLPLTSQRGSGNTSPPPDESKNADLYDNTLPIVKGDVAPAGVMVQIEATGHDGSTRRWGTDETWRARRAEAWWHEAPRHSDTVYQEVFDAARWPVGWTRPGFDDSTWGAARLVRDPAAPSGRPARGGHTGHWKLVPRDLPIEQVDVVYPTAVVEVGEVLAMHGNWDRALVAERLSIERIRPCDKAEVRDADELVGGRGAATLVGSDPSEDWRTFDGLREPVLVVDFGEVMNGRLEIEVEGEAGAVLELGYASHIAGDGVIPGVSRRGRHADRYELREGAQRWRTFGWRSFRYLKLVGRHLSRPLTISRVSVERLNYGGVVVGSFACGDPALARLWEPSVETTRLCGLDQVMDNPSRERKQWSGEITSMVLACQAVYGPTPLIGRYLRSFYRLQTPSGHLPKIAPWLVSLRAEHDIFDEALWLLIRTWDHHLQTGDDELIHEASSGVRRFLEYCERFEAADGTLDSAPLHLYVDWAPIDLRGVSLIVNGLYLLAIEAGAKVLAAAGSQDTSDVLANKGARLRAALTDRFWDASRGRFFDAEVAGAPSPVASEHALGLALIAGVATAAQAQRAIETWSDATADLAVAQPPFVLPLAEGLAAHGRVDLAVAVLSERFGRFLDAGSTTFGELWHLWGNQGSARAFSGSPAPAGVAPERRWYPRDDRAVAQGAAAWVGHYLHTHVLGIRACAPGFTRFAVAPAPGSGVAWSEGRVGTPFGLVSARWEVSGDRLTVDVAHPPACSPELIVPVGWQRGTESIEPGRVQWCLHAVPTA